MSRIGNKPVALPSGVEVIVAENNLVTVKGPKGELSRTFNANMQITVEGNELTVVRPNDNKENKMLHGTTWNFWQRQVHPSSHDGRTGHTYQWNCDCQGRRIGKEERRTAYHLSPSKYRFYFSKL